MTRLVSIHRYPVKGLSSNELSEIDLVPGQGIAFDRAYALAHGDTEFDPQKPEHMSKTKFLMLMKDAKLAHLGTAFFEEEERLVLEKDGMVVLDARLREAEDQARINKFFEDYMEGKTRGGVRVVMAPGHSFTDIAANNLSLINLDSVRDFEEKSGLTVDPIRFRGNLYVEGLGAWKEFDMVDREFTIGSVRFRGAKRTDRCAATNVNPSTAEMDMNIPLQLRKTYGHFDMGIYVDVLEAGTLRKGDELVDQALYI
ncbi:MOSC domain-containing protein [Emcibacter sp.]|uniref:MOSC domain-containing protein n=1 Tax=Emcibacter sp. TaxID=1979954 RepID=UPI003A8ED655